MFFLAGCQLFALGLVGEYIGRVFQAVRHRPAYILEKVYKFSNGVRLNIAAKKFMYAEMGCNGPYSCP